MSAELLELGVADLAAAIAAGEADAAETLDAYAAWVEASAPQTGAFLATDFDRARAGLPAALDRGGALAGVPMAIKDLIHVEGFATTCGSQILRGYRPPFEATAIERLRAAGAVFYGKLNMDEFAMGSSNENSAYHPVHNPWNLDHAPGGSSGGSAAAVAARQTPATLGSDTGGSIRQPAAFCGITGLKPTYGRVSRYGLVAFASSLDQIGPMGRSAADCAVLLETIAGHDPRDATAAEEPAPRAADCLAPLPGGLRIGLPAEYWGDGVDAPVRAAVEAVADWAKTEGHTVVRVALPHTDYAIAVYYLIATAEASSNLGRYDGVRYGHRATAGGLQSMYTHTRGEGFGTEVKRRIMLGTFALSSGYYDAYYGKAQRVRTRIRRDFDEAWTQADVLLTPTAPATAFKLGERTDDPLQMYLSDVFTSGANLAGVPGISFPCGFDGDGLPIGAQLIAPPYREDRLLQFVHAWQQSTDHHRRRPPLSPGSAGMSWQAVIGLEIHAQLATQSKIFCGCANRFGDEANHNTCPVCTGQPGVLPVLNAQAVDYAVQAALALGCTIHERSVFARKHYFYPDLPKAYQISQYEEPYATGGRIEIVTAEGPKTIGITRIHMEEDAGKNVHGEGNDPHSYVDFNRTGSPLIEIVSEPDMRTAAEAAAYMREVHSVLRTLGVSDADMEKGNFRCDANVSVRRGADAPFGTKAELKNINSFRFVERAIEYEIARQVAVLEDGGEVVQETRLFDSASGKTHAMRGKEEAHDYRYFPDPDLPPLAIAAARIDELRVALPELPAAKRQRYRRDMGLGVDDAQALSGERDVATYFEATVAAGAEAKAAANWVTNDVLRLAGDGLATFAIGPERLAALLALVQQGAISTTIAKDVFERMLADERAPETIVEAEGLAQINDADALATTIDEILAAHPDEVERFRGGDQKLFGFFMGQVMKVTRGKANPEAARDLLQSKLRG